MLYYTITVKDYLDTLMKSKTLKPKKTNKKALKNFAKKLNTTLHLSRTDTICVYVYQLLNDEARILGRCYNKNFEKDMIEIVGKTLNIPDNIEGEEVDAETYYRLLGTLTDAGGFEKKLVPEVRLLMAIEGPDCPEFYGNDEFAAKNKVGEEGEKDSYKELQNLIGLDNVKSLTNQIIATTVMDKKRSTLKKEQRYSSKHMIFTGEPGSAKTTVARLLAGALKEKGALATGAFVECGRQDLVGKYTGWTATQVAEKFQEARGGVLFIDEAYSLASRDDFGPEAINTIVQEMENHREDVIVIFAGYPDKMEKFLAKNQGLRSRVAFHVDFPNYNTNELVDIFKKMLNDKGFTMEEDGIKYVREMCEAASHVQDFGNGRFVRNIIEQAIMKQSQRLLEAYGSENVPEDELFILKKEDINMDNLGYKDVPQVQFKRSPIGFVA